MLGFHSISAAPLSSLITEARFEWDKKKNAINIKKHGISFYEAQKAFEDKQRIIANDIKHSTKEEERYYCFGKIDENIVTVRFTYRKIKNTTKARIRIIGAGYWREGRKIYEKENS